jgi:hypothetical protein
MADRAETCSFVKIDKTSVVCDYVSTYTYDLLTPVRMSSLKIV